MDNKQTATCGLPVGVRRLLLLLLLLLLFLCLRGFRRLAAGVPFGFEGFADVDDVVGEFLVECVEVAVGDADVVVVAVGLEGVAEVGGVGALALADEGSPATRNPGNLGNNSLIP